MKARAAIGVCLAALICAATAFGQEGKTILEETHRDWKSQVTYGEVDIRFRALSAFAEANDYVLLVFDRQPGQCEMQTVTMFVLLGRPAKEDFVSEDLNGALRVDEQPIRNIVYDFVMDKGAPVMFARLRNWDKDSTFLPELQRGSVLRFKLSTPRKDYFLRFSLQGFAAASQRTLTLCREFKRSDDRRYFEEAPRRSDQDYFRDNRPSTGRMQPL